MQTFVIRFIVCVSVFVNQLTSLHAHLEPESIALEHHNNTEIEQNLSQALRYYQQQLSHLHTLQNRCKTVDPEIFLALTQRIEDLLQQLYNMIKTADASANDSALLIGECQGVLNSIWVLISQKKPKKTSTACSIESQPQATYVLNPNLDHTLQSRTMSDLNAGQPPSRPYTSADLRHEQKQGILKTPATQQHHIPSHFEKNTLDTDF